MLIDSHCHIYVEDFDIDREDMLGRAKQVGVTKFLMPAIDSSTHEQMLKLEKMHPSECLSMMGLHPCSVKENYENELAIVEGHTKQRKFIAIGEIGLDFYWDKTFTKQQYDSFERQIVLAMKLDLPIVIHSRESIDQCIEVVGKYKGVRGVFHCFSGNADQARRIIELGFFLGIGGVITFKNSGLDKVMKDVSLEHVILETDSPYLAPVPYRGKRNECGYLKYVVEKFAEVKGVSREVIEQTTTKNTQKLFDL